MKQKSGKTMSIVLIAVMVVAMILLVVTHVDPVQTLLGMLIGVFVLVVIVDGGNQRVLKKQLGPGIQEEIDSGRSYVTDVSSQVLTLLKNGKKIEAIRKLKESSGIGLAEAKNKLDEIHLRLNMGQTVSSRTESERNW